MSLEFNPSNQEQPKPDNLQKRFEGKLAGGGEGEGFLELSDDKEEKRKRQLEEISYTREGKESTFDFVNERINQEITEILKKRGVDGLDTEGYAKVRKEAIEKAVEKMKLESPEFSAVVGEVDKVVEEESNKLTTALEKNDVAKEVVDESRRGFLKMLGLGAVVATAAMVIPKNAEARRNNVESDEGHIYLALMSNNEYIEELLSITDDDIKSINKWQTDNRAKVGLATGGAVAGIITAIKSRSLVAGAVVGVPGALLGGIIGNEINSPKSPAAKSVGDRLGNIGSDGKLVDRELILEEIKKTQETNKRLIQALKLLSPGQSNF